MQKLDFSAADLRGVRDEFETILQSPREEDSQRFLVANPWILTTALAPPALGGHPQDCIAKFRFGNEFVSDFVIVYGSSYHYDVILIELEPPTERPFTKDGKYANRLNGALAQVSDWQAWIYENETFFRRSLALLMSSKYAAGQVGGREYERSIATPGIRGRFFTSSKVIVGRRSMLSRRDNERRATVLDQSNKRLEIVPYDRLLDAVDYALSYAS